MNRLSLSIAWRYLCAIQHQKTIGFMVRVCTLGIFIGSFALMMTLMIMHGFEAVTHEKMQSIHADITIEPPFGTTLALTPLRSMLEATYPNEITAISGSNTRQIILEHQNKELVVMLKSIEPSHEQNVSKLATYVHTQIPPRVSPAPKSSLDELLQKESLVLGYKAAQNLGLHIGDTVTVYVPEPGRSKIHLHKKKATITGVLRVGLDEFDQSIALSRLIFQRTLFDEQHDHGVDKLHIKINTNRSYIWPLNVCNPKKRPLIDRLRTKLPRMQVNTWQALNEALVSSLKLEKYVSFLILLLISFVASLNMVCMLILHAEQKKRDIAILRTMGMPAKDISMIFTTMGMCITIFATTAGLCVAAIVGIVLKKYPITLPDVYYISQLPIHMHPFLFIIVFCAACFLGLAATYIPTRTIKKNSIVGILRSE